MKSFEEKKSIRYNTRMKIFIMQMEQIKCKLKLVQWKTSIYTQYWQKQMKEKSEHAHMSHTPTLTKIQ